MNEEIKKLRKEIQVLREDLERLRESLRQETDYLIRMFNSYAADFNWIIGSSIEAMSLIRYFVLMRRKIDLEDLEEVISCLERLEEKRLLTKFEYLRKFTLERENIILGSLFELAKRKKISSGGVLSLLLKKFNKESLREIVLIEDILETFGTEEATRWRRMLE